MAYAQNTEVSVDKSRAELERTLAKYGASHFGYMTSPEGAAVQFVFNQKAIRFALPLPNRISKEFTEYESRGKLYKREDAAALRLWEQACRQRWRALNLVVKAKLEAVEAGITTLEEEFMAHFVMPNGQTFGQYALPQMRESIELKKMPPLLALPSRS